MSSYLSNSFETLHNSVKWSFENTVDALGTSSRKVQGLHVWASTEEEETEAEAPQKYKKIIREFPSFKSVLLDAHESNFTEEM